MTAHFCFSAMQMKLTVQQENIEEMTEKIEALTEELTKVLRDFLTYLKSGPGAC